MKKTKVGLRRALSVFMAFALLLTTVVFFNIGAAAATSAISVTANQDDQAYLYVPEQVYLQPDLDSYKTQDRYNFQWFVDSSVNTSTHLAVPRTGENATGNFYFYYAHATKVTVSFKYLNSNFSEMTAYTMSSSSTDTANYANVNSTIKFAGQPAISASNTRTSSQGSQFITPGNEVNTTLEQESLSPYLLAGTTGYYIEWTVRYLDGRDNIERAVNAYTYVYKPYVEPVGGATRVRNGRGNDHFGQSLSWISGVHGVTEQGDRFPKTSGNGLVTFSSSAAGTAVGSLNAQFPSNWLYSGISNAGSEGWFEGTSTIFNDKNFRYANQDDGTGYSGDWGCYAYAASPIAKLTVDNSRYSNLNQIPNLSLGLMVTDDEASDSGAAVFAKNYSTGTSSDTTTTYGSAQKGENPGNATSLWNAGDGASIYSEGTYTNRSASESEGVKFNVKWNRSISTSSASGRYDIRTGYMNHQGKDTAWNVYGLKTNITMVNKANLRSALNRAYGISGKLGIDIENASVYYNTSSSAWVKFVELYKAAGLMLTALDSAPAVTAYGVNYTTPDTLAAALNNAIDNIESARLTSTATVRFAEIATNVERNYETKQLVDPSTDSAVANETKSYQYGNNITVTPPEFEGYTFAGYGLGTSTAYGVVGSDYSSLLASTSAPETVSFANEANVSYTLYYVPKVVNLTIDTKGGTYNLMKAKTSDYPADLGGVAYPSYTANSAIETDLNYTIEDNDVVVYSTQNTTSQQYQFLPFYVDLEGNTGYTVSYTVQGTDPANVQLSLYNPNFFGGMTDAPSTYLVENNAFKTGLHDEGRAYIKVEITGNARSGKELRICDLCVTKSDNNTLYCETSSEYPTTYSAPSTLKNDMNYTVAGTQTLTVSSRYSTVGYAQRQLLPYYVDLNPGCTYELTYGLSNITEEHIKFELIGANGSVYTFNGSGSTITAGLTDNSKAQLKITFLDVTTPTTATVSNLYLNCLDSKTVITGKTNETMTVGIPVKEGYRFNGWISHGETSSATSGTLTRYQSTNSYDFTLGTSSDVLEATWAVETCRVVFRSADGEVYSTQIVERGADAVAPSVAPSLFGHTFTGWDASYTNVQSDLYIEPVFDEIDINVNFDKASLTMFENHSDTTTVSFVPNEAEISNVVWTSSNPDVISVASSGTKNTTATVEGLAPGSATLTATVTYDGRTYSNSIPVTVNALTPVSMVVSAEPTKMTYFKGETFDATGLQVKVSYNDGQTEKFYDYGTTYPNATLTVSNVNTSMAGNKSCTVTFKEGTKTLTAKITVVVKNIVVDSIEVTTPPTLTDYYVGDYELDTTGIVITAYYNNGTTEILSEDDVEFSELIAEVPGTETITVTYNYTKTATFNVTIHALELESISVKTMPKTAYFVGDAESTAGLTLTANYSNGTTETITSGFTTSGFDSATAGTKTITVAYDGKTTTYTVNVAAVVLQSIAVKTMPKAEYFVGEAENTAGLTLTATYNNGTTETITSGFTTSGFDSATAGTKTITVAYGGKTTTYTVNVTAVVLQSIAVKTMPKADYFVGEAEDTAGLTLTATYNNGTTETVTTGFTTSGFNSATAGTKTITVAYGGKTTTYTVNVTAVVVTGITVKTMPKTAYFVGEAEDLAGLEITATYNNGTSADLTTGFTVTGFDSATAGTKTITVAFGGKTTTYTVNVTAIVIESIVIKTAPAKVTYFVGDDADFAGLEITASYNNGTSVDLTEGFTTAGFDSATAGTKTITVSYEGKTATFDVTVNPVVLTGIVIKSAPAKTVYLSGEAADFTGLEITASYNNGTSVDLTEGFTTSGFDSATAGTKTITVDYEGKTATFEVTVNWNFADYTEVDNVIAVAEAEIATGYYTEESVADLNSYIDAVVERDLLATEQPRVDAMAQSIYNAIGTILVDKSLDVTAFDAELSKVPEELDNYTADSVEAMNTAMENAIQFVQNNNTIRKQPEFDALVSAFATAVANLTPKAADYTELDALIDYVEYIDANGMDPDGKVFSNYMDIYWTYFVDFIPNAKSEENRGFNIFEQANVDALTAELQSYIDMLEEESTEPPAPVESFTLVNGAESFESAGVKYIRGLKTQLSRAGFLNNYVETENVTVTVSYASGTRYLGTGSVVTVTSDATGEVIDQYIIIIYGDLNGNGRIENEDSLLIKNSTTGKGELLTAMQKLAGNVIGTRATVNTQDAEAIASVASGAGEIDQLTGKVIVAI